MGETICDQRRMGVGHTSYNEYTKKIKKYKTFNGEYSACPVPFVSNRQVEW